jgi:HJR/Mrr/RecB family endonuclease
VPGSGYLGAIRAVTEAVRVQREELRLQRLEKRRRRRESIAQIERLEELAATNTAPESLPVLGDFGISEDDAQSALHIITQHERRKQQRSESIIAAYRIAAACCALCAFFLAFTRPIFWLVLVLCWLTHAFLEDKLPSLLSRMGQPAAAQHPEQQELIDILNRFSVLQHKFDQIRLQEVKLQQEEKQRKQAEHQLQELEKRRQTEMYWSQMDCRAFEFEIARLYQKLGYEAEVTRQSVDGGIDIKLRKDNEFWVVQCKRQNAPVGVRIARELFGVMHSEGASRCILACTGGFNSNVRDFAKNKPITLLGLQDIISLAQNANTSSHCSDQPQEVKTFVTSEAQESLF